MSTQPSGPADETHEILFVAPGHRLYRSVVAYCRAHNIWCVVSNNPGVPRSTTHVAAFGSPRRLDDFISWLDTEFPWMSASSTLRAEPKGTGAELSRFVREHTRATRPGDALSGGQELNI